MKKTFQTSASVDGGRTECLPDDGLTDVRCDEEGDAGSESVTFLEQFVEKEDNEAGDKELLTVGQIKIN